MSKAGSYEIIDGVEVLVDPVTQPAPGPDAPDNPDTDSNTEFPAISARAETEFPPGDAVTPPAGSGGKRGRGGPSSAAPAPPQTKE